VKRRPGSGKGRLLVSTSDKAKARQVVVELGDFGEGFGRPRPRRRSSGAGTWAGSCHSHGETGTSSSTRRARPRDDVFRPIGLGRWAVGRWAGLGRRQTCRGQAEKPKDYLVWTSASVVHQPPRWPNKVFNPFAFYFEKTNFTPIYV